MRISVISAFGRIICRDGNRNDCCIDLLWSRLASSLSALGGYDELSGYLPKGEAQVRPG